MTPPPPPDDRAAETKEELREALAAYAHEAWSGWMAYLFSKCNHIGYGLGIPDWAVERWQRQATTPYADLPESEKESDRSEADKMLALVGAALDAAHQDRIESVAIVKAEAAVNWSIASHALDQWEEWVDSELEGTATYANTKAEIANLRAALGSGAALQETTP